MNQIDSHVVTVCPKCSTNLTIQPQQIGQDVTCDRCQHTFRAAATHGPIASSSGGSAAEPPIQTAHPDDRIALACPTCKVTLNVRRIYVGNEVLCKYCGNSFIVRIPARQSAPLELDPLGFTLADLPTGDVQQAKPEGQAAPDALRAQHDQLLADRDRLRAAHTQLSAEHTRLTSEHERLSTEHSQLSAHKDRLTTELNTIRSRLGTIAPEQVRPLAEEREALRAEVKRLADEASTLRTELSARANIAAGVDQRNADLAAVRAECDLFRTQLKERDRDLTATRTERNSLRVQLKEYDQELKAAGAERDSLRPQLEQRDQALKAASTERDALRAQLEQRDLAIKATVAERDALRIQLKERDRDLKAAQDEQGRLSVERQNALKAIEQLRAELGERDQAISGATGTLRAEVDSLRQALDAAAGTHREEQDKLSAELAGLGEQHRQLQEQHRSVDELCKQYRDRNEELTLAHDRLTAGYQALLDSGRLQQEQWAEQLRQLRVQAVQAARDQAASENATPSSAHASADQELQAARAELADLKRRFRDLESLNREISEVLNGIGIAYKPINV